ncbi:hypothetical protein JOD29_000345 [Lysinibacillus composti]|uniref:Resolvase HTH domain-containing protein n=1 Tax=Lysinibacillus composti TaxID=720633 RepID=A0A3N9UK61_9BACI|nr:hypothetical protein [Lysinibacillus composti]MBM7607108.1 hypothetical protein [Lysinibacillus composti]RQW76300.1 hypothetical protein EBB45_01765 [Lysinibacillus composti]
MDLSIIIMLVGIFCIIGSFFLKDPAKKVEKDLEELSIGIYQETNALKRRLKVVEEELLLDANFKIDTSKTTTNPKNSFDSYKQPTASTKHPINYSGSNTSKPVNEILVRQVIELNKQGYPIVEISKMSTLSVEQIHTILSGEGGKR